MSPHRFLLPKSLLSSICQGISHVPGWFEPVRDRSRDQKWLSWKCPPLPKLGGQSCSEAKFAQFADAYSKFWLRAPGARRRSHTLRFKTDARGHGQISPPVLCSTPQFTIVTVTTTRGKRGSVASSYGHAARTGRHSVPVLSSTPQTHSLHGGRRPGSSSQYHSTDTFATRSKETGFQFSVPLHSPQPMHGRGRLSSFTAPTQHLRPHIA